MTDENNEAIRLTADTVLIAPDADGLENVLLIRRRRRGRSRRGRPRTS